MNILIESWLPIGSLVVLAFGLALKDAKQAYRLRCLERENARLMEELEKAKQELAKARGWGCA